MVNPNKWAENWYRMLPKRDRKYILRRLIAALEGELSALKRELEELEKQNDGDVNI